MEIGVACRQGVLPERLRQDGGKGVESREDGHPRAVELKGEKVRGKVRDLGHRGPELEEQAKEYAVGSQQWM